MSFLDTVTDILSKYGIWIIIAIVVSLFVILFYIFSGKSVPINEVMPKP